MPNSTGLSPKWNRWRRERQADLRSKGLDLANAAAIARTEAAVRANLASRVGGEFAEDARLVVRIAENGRIRAFVAADSLDAVPEQLRHLFRQMSPLES